MNPTKIHAIVNRQETQLFDDLLACGLAASVLAGGVLALLSSLGL